MPTEFFQASVGELFAWLGIIFAAAFVIYHLFVKDWVASHNDRDRNNDRC